MLLEAYPLVPPEGEPSPPFSEPAEKPEPPQSCMVGMNTSKPCFAECKAMLWNADIGYWYRAYPKQRAHPKRNGFLVGRSRAPVSECGSLDPKWRKAFLERGSPAGRKCWSVAPNALAYEVHFSSVCICWIVVPLVLNLLSICWTVALSVGAWLLFQESGSHGWHPLVLCRMEDGAPKVRFLQKHRLREE